jgi:hypothetical protein
VDHNSGFGSRSGNGCRTECAGYEDGYQGKGGAIEFHEADCESPWSAGNLETIRVDGGNVKVLGVHAQATTAEFWTEAAFIEGRFGGLEF